MSSTVSSVFHKFDCNEKRFEQAMNSCNVSSGRGGMGAHKTKYSRMPSGNTYDTQLVHKIDYSPFTSLSSLPDIFRYQ